MRSTSGSSRHTLRLSSLLIAALGGLLFSQAAHGAEKGFSSKVHATLADSDTYGGCVASITMGSNPGLNCSTDSNGRAWVTFSCDGTYASPYIASKNFQQAQIAMLADRKLGIRVDDSAKQGGLCFAYRTVLQ